MKRFFLLMALFIAGCEQNEPNDSEGSFAVTVFSDDSTAVQGATVEGGIDWESYQVQTDEKGVAILPASARGQWSSIYLTNYHPRIISAMTPGRYVLNKTSKKLVPIGNINGMVIRFNPDEIITVEYDGTYRIYAYSGSSASETFRQQLHDSARAVSETLLTGDTLWFTTENAGVFAFSISQPASPAFLFRLKIPGVLGPFTVKDSVMILGDPLKPGPLRIVAFDAMGTYRELSAVYNYFVRQMTHIGNAVVLLGNNDCLPAVFDISNPRLPRLLYNGLEWEYQSGFFDHNHIILTPQYGYGGSSIQIDYKVMDLTDPSNPIIKNPFSADSWIDGLASSNWAYGSYYGHSPTISIMYGNMEIGFKTVATVSERIFTGVTGALPPYFVMGNRLWKLTN